MKTLSALLIALITLLGLSTASASKAVWNRPYVQSGPGGIFYARCIPKEKLGSAGFTEIFEVQKEQDKLLDHYDWFAKGGVILGWSPIAGKVAVMAIHPGTAAKPDKQVDLSFSLGGKLLKSWTTAELKGLGAEVIHNDYDREDRAIFQTVACEQIPNTNEYVFTIQIAANKKLRFDILTGDIYSK
ncbi:MAG: hypothetical protein JWM68_4629 [Verrucomicrobiales bacterium]|nr:hypothetical protein [Verrucomicrobiales bacterium]